METLQNLLAQGSFLLLALICAGVVFWGLRKVLPQTSFSENKKSRILTGFIVAVAVWVVILAVLSLSGFLSDFESLPPRLFIVLIIPLFTILVLTFSSGMKEILLHTPPNWLVLMQSFRIPVELLLWWLFISQLLPLHMTFEGRNFDVLSGLLALPAAFVMRTNPGLRKTTGIAYNILGLLLLINIVGMAILSLPTPFRVFMEEPSNTVVATFPVVLLPGILVPLAYAMHFFSLRQLLAIKTQEKPVTAKTASELPI